jgi:flagellar protein FliS
VPFDARARYRETTLTTMSPPQLVVALYERLGRDLAEASAAIAQRRPAQAHLALVHAQDIVMALAGALDLEVWPEGVSLKRIYDFLLERLVATNLNKDALTLAGCDQIVATLTDAWREAGRRILAGAPA